VPTCQGQGPALHDWSVGQQQGVQFVTLIQSEMPFHTHSLQALNDTATTPNPNQAVLAKGGYETGTQGGAVAFYQTAAPNTNMNFQSISIAGGSLPHHNMMPYLTVNYCIALQGVFPQRG
jgi:microcystin-dependent protein